jgi:hypothetical protein
MQNPGPFVKTRDQNDLGSPTWVLCAAAIRNCEPKRPHGPFGLSDCVRGLVWLGQILDVALGL